MDNVVVGNLCGDPILRQPRRGGRPTARFTVAVNNWRRVGEEFVERPPVFHRVVCFGRLAENVTNSLHKGVEVLAVGEWVDDSYTDEQGQRRVQVAMEARAVGPALRRAVAAVRKVDYRPDSDILQIGLQQASTQQAGAPPVVGAEPSPVAGVAAESPAVGVAPAESSSERGPTLSSVPTPETVAEASDVPETITDSFPGAVTPAELLATGLVTPATSATRRGARRRGERDVEPVPARGG